MEPHKSSPSTEEHRESAENIRLRCAVLTCSDTRTEETDTSGGYIIKSLTAAGHEITAYQIVPDETGLVGTSIDTHLSNDVDVILINGGTGISRRDVTYDVVAAKLEKTIPGFGELFRMLSWDEVGAASMLSRATAGIVGRTLIFSMPGSTNAVKLAVNKLLLPELRHLAWELRRQEN